MYSNLMAMPLGDTVSVPDHSQYLWPSQGTSQLPEKIEIANSIWLKLQIGYIGSHITHIQYATLVL